MIKDFTYVDYTPNGVDLSQLRAPIEHPNYDFKLEDHPEIMEQIKQKLRGRLSQIGFNNRQPVFEEFELEDLEKDNKD